MYKWLNSNEKKNKKHDSKMKHKWRKNYSDKYKRRYDEHTKWIFNKWNKINKFGFNFDQNIIIKNGTL
jgi:hypothetical protein